MEGKTARIGLVGVGNCASSFVQGLHHYAEAANNQPPPGLMNVELGGYHVRDLRIVSAFDIHADKVGRDVTEAIFAAPNNTMRFAAPPPPGSPSCAVPPLTGSANMSRRTSGRATPRRSTWFRR